jgi:hypothetical protein
MSIHFLSHQDEEQAADVRRRREFIQRMERKLEVKEALQRPRHQRIE